MNLIEVQDKLRAMPMQVLQQYANGSNPEVPPYIALGVIQEKQAMQQRMGMQQGAAQGDMPTVKEKVEQSAGLMGLMQGKQQQAAQQQAETSARAPGPVPGSVPPAEPQPEPTAMRHGGIVGLPSNLNLANGGIVAFAGGGQAEKKEPDAAARAAVAEAQRTGDRNAMLSTLKKLAAVGYDVATLVPRAFMGVAEDLANTRLGRALGVDFEFPEEAFGGDRESMTPMLDKVQQQEAPTKAPGAPLPSTGAGAGRGKGGNPGFPPEGPGAPKRPPVAGQTRPMTAPAPVAAPVAAPPKGLPELNLPQAPASETQTMMMEALKNKPAQMSMEDYFAQQRAIRAEAGTDKPYGQETRKGLDALQKQYEDNRPTDMQNNIRMFSRAAQSKGGTGFAPAYLQGIDERRAADQKMARDMLNARAGLEKDERTEAATRETGLRTGFGDTQKLFSEEKRNRLTNLTSARGQEVDQARAELSARVQMYGADRSYEAAMAQLNAANRRADTADTKATIDAIKFDIQAATAELKDLQKFGDPTAKERRAILQARIDGLSRALQEAGGVNIPPPPAGGGTELPPGVIVKKVKP